MDLFAGTWYFGARDDKESKTQCTLAGSFHYYGKFSQCWTPLNLRPFDNSGSELHTMPDISWNMPLPSRATEGAGTPLECRIFQWKTCFCVGSCSEIHLNLFRDFSKRVSSQSIQTWHEPLVPHCPPDIPFLFMVVVSHAAPHSSAVQEFTRHGRVTWAFGRSAKWSIQQRNELEMSKKRGWASNLWLLNYA